MSATCSVPASPELSLPDLPTPDPLTSNPPTNLQRRSELETRSDGTRRAGRNTSANTGAASSCDNGIAPGARVHRGA